MSFREGHFFSLNEKEQYGATENSFPEIQLEAYSEEDTAYREFMVKLRHVKKSLQTREGKRLAKGRHAFMEKYFKRLKEEALGKK